MNTESNRNALVKWATPLVGGALVIVVIYALLGTIEKTGLQIVATGLLLAIPVAYALGLQTAKAHTRGLEHGVAVKVTAQKARSKRVTNRDHFLPDVQRGEALLVVQDDETDAPIDM